MIDYLFSVDLRFRHPFGSPTDITDALQILPDRSWTVGEARRTPKGAPLKGAYKESYWFARLFDGASVNYGLIRAIDDTLARFADRKNFFQHFAASGGRAELFIGLFFPDGNGGDTIKHELLTRLADFKLDLSLEIYPEAQS